MRGCPYTADEDAVLRPYVTRPVTNWRAVLMRLPGRTLYSGRSRLRLLREEHDVFMRLPTGGAAQNWRDAA